MRLSLPLLAVSALLAPVQSLYFYIEGQNPKCFFERLPKDTLVVGKYSAEEFNLDRNAYEKNDNLKIFISVDVGYLISSIPFLDISSMSSWLATP
jgi:hypothetical protein